jgi:hypothetical protein
MKELATRIRQRTDVDAVLASQAPDTAYACERTRSRKRLPRMKMFQSTDLGPRDIAVFSSQAPRYGLRLRAAPAVHSDELDRSCHWIVFDKLS